MRRIIAIVLGALAFVFGSVLIPAASASSATCNASPGATQDDGICGINPHDYSNYILNQQSSIDNLQRSVDAITGLAITLFVIIALLSVYLVYKNYKRDQKDEKAQTLKKPELEPAS